MSIEDRAWAEPLTVPSAREAAMDDRKPTEAEYARAAAGFESRYSPEQIAQMEDDRPF